MSQPLITTIDPSQITRASGGYLADLVMGSSDPCLVLLSGGSAIASYGTLRDRLLTEDKVAVTIGQVDERFGPVDHKGSNAWAIEDQTHVWSVCKERGVDFRQMLSGDSMEESAAAYDAWLSEMFSVCPRRIAVLGVGADGHTAGILPGEAGEFAKTFMGERLVVSYTATASEFRQRITMTPFALKQMTEVIVVTVGETKRRALEQALAQPALPLDRVPAAILQQIPHVQIFTDQVV